VELTETICLTPILYLFISDVQVIIQHVVREEKAEVAGPYKVHFSDVI